jgi:hypothetical protein
MTVVARTFVSIPVRSARETWDAICNLVAPNRNSGAARELSSVAGVAASLIAREAMTAPIVVYGSGPRVRIYCLYNADAIEGDDSNESALVFDATEGDWQMSLPCPADDLTWVQSELAQRSKRITARDQEAKVGEDETEADSARSFVLKLDEGAFFRP